MIGTIMNTEAVLISNPNSKHQKLVNKVHKRLLGFITAKKYRMVTYNVSKDQLPLAQRITPGRKAPTVNALFNEDFFAVSAMVERSDVADIMDSLAELGATDIMVFDIENCRA